MKISHQLAVLVGVLAIVIVVIGTLGLTEKKATLDRLQTVYEDRVVTLKLLSNKDKSLSPSTNEWEEF